ncbi:MAG TPA: YggT family protein [Anaerolineales bacterium]|nr:YggT family protein [Anaerolineales bacterium]
MIEALAYILVLLFNLLSLVVFVHVILSWVMPLDHPVRSGLGRIVEPMLQPIRNILPQTGMIDFSPMILLILLQLLQQLLAQTFL